MDYFQASLNIRGLESLIGMETRLFDNGVFTRSECMFFAVVAAIAHETRGVARKFEREGRAIISIFF